MTGLITKTVGRSILGAMLLTNVAFSQGWDWPMFGRDTANSASASSGVRLDNISNLKMKWAATTGGDVSARAAVVNGVVYFPDWGGNLWALDAKTGKTIWSHQLSDYGLPAKTVSRTSPAVVDGTLYIGTQGGAWLVAIDACKGTLKWKTQLETVDTLAMITSSPAVVDGMIYEGVASNQEFAAVEASFPCCTARGSIVAVDAYTGIVKWKTYTIPTGYSGGGVWGSNPVIDTNLHTLFIGTGNNYSAPTDPAYVSCVAGGKTPAACQSPDDHVDSILALDLATGKIKWSQQMTQLSMGTDDWNVGCAVTPIENCPASPGPDFDFGSAPNEITYFTEWGPRTILGAGQKSGVYSAFDPETGKLLWQTQVGPGSSLGGIEWGSATDGKRIYVAIANLYGIPYAGGSAGSWAALDPATGKILWQTPDPNKAVDLGPLAVANGVVYAESMAGAATAPTMFALDASTGKVVWNYAAGSSVNAGATLVGNQVFWGSGYAHLGIPGYTGGTNKFYMFSTDDNDWWE